MLPHRSHICVLIVSLPLVSGCITKRGVARDDTAPMTSSTAVSAVQRTYDILTSREITAKGVRTAYDAIVQLRPEFLKPPSPPLTPAALRSRQGADELLEERDGRFPSVFLNGVRYGAPSVLRTIPAPTIIEIRYFPGAHVPARYGFENRDGVIDVRTTT